MTQPTVDSTRHGSLSVDRRKLPPVRAGREQRRANGSKGSSGRTVRPEYPVPQCKRSGAGQLLRAIRNGIFPARMVFRIPERSTDARGKARMVLDQLLVSLTDISLSTARGSAFVDRCAAHVKWTYVTEGTVLSAPAWIVRGTEPSGGQQGPQTQQRHLPVSQEVPLLDLRTTGRGDRI